MTNILAALILGACIIIAGWLVYTGLTTCVDCLPPGPFGEATERQA